MAKKQTAGRDILGEFAPKFAELNDDVLFGAIWAREEELSPRDRSMITVSALIAGGNIEQLTPQPSKSEGKRINKRGNCRNHHSPLVLCRMAQSLVSISYRKKNLQK
ncbi:carboxymuconolactone decarboxylase family protein [Bacillus inaquosorum]